MDLILEKTYIFYVKFLNYKKFIQNTKFQSQRNFWNAYQKVFQILNNEKNSVIGYDIYTIIMDLFLSLQLFCYVCILCAVIFECGLFKKIYVSNK